MKNRLLKITAVLAVMLPVVVLAEVISEQLHFMTPEENGLYSEIYVEAETQTPAALNVYICQYDGGPRIPVALDDIIFTEKTKFKITPQLVSGRNFLQIAKIDHNNQTLAVRFIELPVDNIDLLAFQNMMDQTYRWWSNGSPMDHISSTVPVVALEVGKVKQFFVKEMPSTTSVSEQSDVMIFLSGKGKIDSQTVLPEDVADEYKIEPRDIILSGLFCVEKKDQNRFINPIRFYFDFNNSNLCLDSFPQKTKIFFCANNQSLLVLSEKITTSLYRIEESFFVKQNLSITSNKFLLNGKIMLKAPSSVETILYGSSFCKAIYGDFCGDVSTFEPKN